MTLWDDIIGPHAEIGRKKATKNKKLIVTRAERNAMLARKADLLADRSLGLSPRSRKKEQTRREGPSKPPSTAPKRAVPRYPAKDDGKE